MVQTVPLGGDYDFVPGGFNANGIVATPDGKQLIIVNSTTGTLYLVAPATGVASAIDLGGASVPAGDGLEIVGHTLYVVQNAFNQVAVVELSGDYGSGEITATISSGEFAVPTTAAAFGSDLYVVNARFNLPPGPYTVVSVPRTP
jgi:sugar lactone lactonase YvrE